MGVRFSLPLATMGFCLAYLVCLHFDLVLFRYYPLHGVFSVKPLGAEAGPAMLWYGLMANASIAGLCAGMLGRDQWMDPRLLWLAPFVAMLAVIYEMRSFFL